MAGDAREVATTEPFGELLIINIILWHMKETAGRAAVMVMIRVLVWAV